MTDKGHLYSSRAAAHPGARIALDDAPTEGVSTHSSELPVALGFWIPVFATVVAGASESAVRGSIGIVTNAVFIATSLFAASRNRREGVWAGWTAPPIAFLLLAIYDANFSGDFTGGLLVRNALGVATLLSEHMWVILGTTAAALAIAIVRKRRD